MSAIHEHVLQNGMTLLCWPQRHLHGLEFGLYLKGGPLYETEETQGISNLLEHLCFRGLGGLNREGLLRELNRFGTNLDAATYAEGLVFRLKCLPRFFDAALEYFLRFFANGAGDDHDEIGVVRFSNAFVPLGAHEVDDARGVIVVHLAAEAAQVDFFSIG